MIHNFLVVSSKYDMCIGLRFFQLSGFPLTNHRQCLKTYSGVSSALPHGHEGSTFLFLLVRYKAEDAVSTKGLTGPEVGFQVQCVTLSHGWEDFVGPQTLLVDFPL